MLLFVLKNNGSLPLAIFPTLGYNKSTIADKETKTMKDGFLKIACVTPPLRVADCTYNADQIIAKAKEAAEQSVILLKNKPAQSLPLSRNFV